MKRVWALALLLALPAAVADDGHLAATALEASGAVASSGPLAALAAVPGATGPAWVEINATRATVETDTIRSVIVAGTVGPPSEPETTRDDTSGAVLRGSAAGADHAFHVRPLKAAVAVIEGTEAQFSPPVTGTSEVPRRVLGRPAAEADVSDAVETRVSGGVLEVRGSFIATFWDWPIESGDGRRFPSGAEIQPVGPAPGPVRGAEEQTLRQVYVLVEDGVLRVPAGGDGLTLFLRDPDATVQGQATFQQAKGSLNLDGRKVDASGYAVVAGDLRLSIAPTGGSALGIGLQGDVDSVTGPSGTFRTADDASFPSWLGWALAAAALGAMLLVYRGLSRLGERAMDAALEAGRFRTVAGLGRLLALRAGREEVAVPLVVSLLRLNRPARARSALARWRHAPVATRLYLEGCILAQTGEEAKAAQALRQALEADPTISVDIAGNPSLRRLAASLGVDQRSSGGYA